MPSKITVCPPCEYYAYECGGHWCKHPAAPSYHDWGRELCDDADELPIQPDWCPLKKGDKKDK